jgi:predicted enzyme related to lactoylglutathione lyase
MNKHRFVWHDLATRDPDGATRFYGEIFNWRFEKSEGSPYLHIISADQMIGGVRHMGPDEPGPTSWLGYVVCDDVAATVAKLTAANGKVLVPPTTMPDVGTFAVTADPSGGVFAPWKSARPGEDVEKPGMAQPFTFCWDELLTTDLDAAAKFYAAVFDWTPHAADMGGGTTYTLLQRPGTKNERGEPIGAGGMMKAPPGVPYSFWLPYVAVENTDEITDKAKRLGATVSVPPTDIPNIGRFSCWMDPQHAPIAVIAMPR